MGAPRWIPKGANVVEASWTGPNVVVTWEIAGATP